MHQLPPLGLMQVGELSFRMLFISRPQFSAQEGDLKMGFRVLILAAMGLGAMYMLHLLAQDYNKIRQPIKAITKTLFRSKRNVKYASVKNDVVSAQNWTAILSNDPFGCLQSLICQLVAGAESNSEEARTILGFLDENRNGNLPKKITMAITNGLRRKGNSESCLVDYQFCFYSARTMLRVLKWSSVE